jgi:hypothetical protein
MNKKVTKKAYHFPFFFRCLTEAWISCPGLVEKVEKGYYAENEHKIERGACCMLRPS